MKFRPDVAAYHAARNLWYGRGWSRDAVASLRMSYCLKSALYQADPIVDRFWVPTYRDLDPWVVALREPYALYDRQRLAVRLMASIKDWATSFEEVEIHESKFLGSTGWSVVARAVRTAQLQTETTPPQCRRMIRVPSEMNSISILSRPTVK